MKAFSHLREELERRKQAGTATRLCELSSAQGAEVQWGEKRCIQLSSNNYLGLASHPRLKAAASEAVEQWGGGNGLGPNDCGNVYFA